MQVSDVPSVQEVFGRAIEMAAVDERSAWLDEVCRGNPELRVEVDQLLAAHDETASFMLRTALGTKTPESDTSLAATPRLPARYRPVCEIARGGMGTVWRVVDEQFQRPMAVKTMLPKIAADAVAIARFEREIQLTGSLQHPAIPPVGDRGFLLESNIPFFSMKLIEGKTFSQLLDGRSTPHQDQANHIDVLEQVCQAVGYAHSQQVVHRDLKPQNIMVGAFGEVQVMDWGMAKLVDEASEPTDPASSKIEFASSIQEPVSDTNASAESLTVTRAGQVMGTLAYMAPEQARGELDASGMKIDVFCLGGILCKILTGFAPFTCEDRLQTYHRIVDGDLSEALNRLDDCDADPELLQLCKECLAANPDDRPLDASEVGDRIGDFRKVVREQMENERAERKAAEVRVVEERKRRRIAVALAVATILLVVGSGVTAWWIQQVTAAANADAAQRAEQAKNDIQSALIRSAELRDSFQLRAANSQLDQASQRLSEVVSSGPLANEIAKSRDTIRFMEELDDIHYRRSIWKDEGFDVDFSIGKDGAYALTFQNHGIEIFGNESAETLGKRLAKHPLSTALVRAMDDWAFHDQANRDRLFQILRIADPDPFRDQLRVPRVLSNAKLLELARQSPLSEQSPSAIDVLCKRLQMAAFVTEDERTRRELHTGSMNVLARSTIAFPDSFDLHFLAGNTAMNLRGEGKWVGKSHAKTYPDDQALIQAVGHFRSALAIRPNNAASVHNLSLCFEYLGEDQEAEIAARTAIKLDRNLARAQKHLARILIRLGDISQAEKLLRSALSTNPDNADALDVLGDLLGKKGQLTDANSTYRRSIELDPQSVTARMGLGLNHMQIAKYEEAEEQFLTALQQPCSSVQRAMIFAALGELYIRTGRDEEAEDAFGKSMKAEPTAAVPYVVFGNELMIKQPKKAESLFRKAIELQPDLPTPYCSLGLILISYRQQVREGAALFMKGHELGSRLPGWNLTDSKRVAWVRRQLELAILLEEFQETGKPPAEASEVLHLAEFARNTMLDNESAYDLYINGLVGFEKEASVNPSVEHLRFRFYHDAATVALRCSETDEADDERRAETRSKALEWLNHCLGAAERKVKSRSIPPPVIAALQNWGVANELERVRGNRIAQLPKEEQQEWKELWKRHANVLESIEKK